MERTIVAQFDTRRGAELAVEHLVQEHGIDRSDIFVRPLGDGNSSGVRPSGADIERSAGGSAEQRGDPELAGPIEISVDCHGGGVEVVRAALERAGGTALSAH